MMFCRFPTDMNPSIVNESTMETTTMTGSIGTSRMIFNSGPRPGALARAGLERSAAPQDRTPVIELVFGPRGICHFAQPQTLSLVVEKLAFVYSRPARSWTRSLSAIFL